MIIFHKHLKMQVKLFSQVINIKHMFGVFQWYEQKFNCGGTGWCVVDYLNQIYTLEAAKNSQ